MQRVRRRIQRSRFGKVAGQFAEGFNVAEQGAAANRVVPASIPDYHSVEHAQRGRATHPLHGPPPMSTTTVLGLVHDFLDQFVCSPAVLMSLGSALRYRNAWWFKRPEIHGHRLIGGGHPLRRPAWDNPRERSCFAPPPKYHPVSGIGRRAV